MQFPNVVGEDIQVNKVFTKTLLERKSITKSPSELGEDLYNDRCFQCLTCLLHQLCVLLTPL
jgi:heterodisulfide reductase subunit C